jgi:hypothetical protein
VGLVVTATSSFALRTISATLAAETPPSALDFSVAGTGARALAIAATRTDQIPCDVPTLAATKWFFGAVAEIGASTAREASAGVRITATVPSVTIRCAPSSLAVTVGGNTYTAPVPPLGKKLNALAVQIDTSQITVGTAVRARIDRAALTFTLASSAIVLVPDTVPKRPSASYVVAPGDATTSARVSLAVVRANVDFDSTDEWLNLECAARTPAPAPPDAQYDGTYVTLHALTTGTIATNSVPASLGVAGTQNDSKVVYSRTDAHALGSVSVSLARQASATVAVEVAETLGAWTQVATRTATELEHRVELTARPASFTRVVVTSAERVLQIAPTFVEPTARVGVALVANGKKVRLTQRCRAGASALSRALSGTPNGVAGVTVSASATRTVGGVRTLLCTLAGQIPMLPANLYATVDSAVVEAEPDPVRYAGVHYAELSSATDVSIVSVLYSAGASSTRALDFGAWNVAVTRTSVTANVTRKMPTATATTLAPPARSAW